MSKERQKVKIKVLAEDPKKEEDQSPDYKKHPKIDTNTGKENEESEEDKLLREKLETTARKLIDSKKNNVKLFHRAVDVLTKEIQSATGSMTSVPKPLKYLRLFYVELKEFYSKVEGLDSELTIKLSDLMAVLAMTMAEEGTREMLHYKLKGNIKALGVWGHEFVRALCGEISLEYASVKQSNTSNSTKMKEKLHKMSRNIVPFLIEQNTETEAVDLLFEIQLLSFLLESDYIDKNNYQRTCLYLTKFAEYVPDIDSLKQILHTTFELYIRSEDLPNALRIALMLNDKKRIGSVFDKKFGESDKEHDLMQKQLGLMLGAHKKFLDDSEINEDIQEYINNDNLPSYFETLTQNLNMQEAKSPEDVYKTHLYDDSFGENTQSARYNLSATYVNAFVNCGFVNDSLLQKNSSESEEASEDNWVFKNKEKGKLAAVASLGLISLWNPDVGVNNLSQWLDETQKDDMCYAGALLGLGINSTGVNTTMSLELIKEELEKEDDPRITKPTSKICVCLSLGLNFAGNPNDEAYEILKDYLSDDEDDANVRFFAALAIGLMYVGSGDSTAASEITTILFDFQEEQFKQPAAKFALLGWALIYLGKQNLEDDKQRENMLSQLEAVTAIENAQLAKFGSVLFDCCAYAGSGNVIQVQKLLHLCAETLNEQGMTQEEESEEQEENNVQGNNDAGDLAEDNTNQKQEVDKLKVAQNSLRQSIAVLGVALITFADPVGRQMADRTFQHLLQYGELAIRRAVPLAMALIRVSEPEYGQIDILSKLTHDSDLPTAMSAIMALGIISAGTTNSRVAQLLRQLAVFYKKDANTLQIVRIAQGLLFTGKGLVTLHPFHSDRTLMSPTAVAAIMTVMVASLDIENTLLSEYHILLYTLAAAIRPRMCLTLADTGKGTLEHVKVKVRVGQAVETVGLAGNPKKITGFQTQESPVLINVGDRVELATDEYESYTSVMEGVVILKKVDNPE